MGSRPQDRASVLKHVRTWELCPAACNMPQQKQMGKEKEKMKKTISIVALVVLVAAVSVLGTLAYLTSQDQVVNTFTVGKVAITLDEMKATSDGKPVVPADRVKANNYKLLPGLTYAKDPTVTVLKGSERSYVKLVVTVSKASESDKLLKECETNLGAVISGYDAANWILKSNTEDKANNTRTYEFWYKEAVDASAADVKLDALFDQIVVPGNITNAQLASIDGLKIDIVAYAIQADGFADADAAWAAFAE